MKRRKLGPTGWWILALVVGVGLAFVFGRWAFLPPQVMDAMATPAQATVSEVTIDQTMPVAVSARWEMAPLGVGAAAGTLTTIDVADGDVVTAGQQLFTVDLRPILIAEGEVPAFRELRQNTAGMDVRQLQQMLVEAGYMTTAPSGVFGAGTTTAVRNLQRSLGMVVDGVVQPGDIVFTPQLPARVIIPSGVAVGQRVNPGDVVLDAVQGYPEFIAAVPAGINFQPNLPVLVVFEGTEVSSIATGATRGDGFGNTLFSLTRPDGAPICGLDCDIVPINPQDAVYPARQVIVAPITAAGLPAAAIDFDANGQAFVTRPGGIITNVTILGQGQGQVVLSGVEIGDIVLLPNSGGQ